MHKLSMTVLALLAAAFILCSQAFFIVDQTQQALVLQLGQPKGEPRKPGLHMKIPMIQDIRYFDKRVLSVDPKPEQVVISSESVSEKNKTQEQSSDNKESRSLQNISGEPIIVDTFARYKIVDPLQFMKTLRTISSANSRLQTILNDATRAALGRTTLKDLLSDEREGIMADIRERVKRET